MKAEQRHAWGSLLVALAMLAAGGCGGFARSSSDLDYVPGSPLAGTINTAGAEAMGPLMNRLAELLRADHPDAVLSVDASGPPHAPAGLAAGTAQIGFTGRTYRPAELAAIERRQGRLPLQFRIGAGAYDNRAITHTMAVFVHRDNPLAGLTLEQVQAIFASDVVLHWGELGWRDAAGAPVHASTGKFGTGAAEFVREAAFAGADWSARVREFATDSEALAAVTADPHGIAIAGLGFQAAGVKPLALRVRETGPFHAPTRDNVVRRRYPLARLLYFHVNAPPPGGRLDPLVREVLTLALSREGQAAVAETGYLPLPDEDLRDERARLAAW